MSSATAVEPYTPAWFEQRRAGIGASEIAAVMGISPWESPFSLYWRKVNGWEFEANPEMEWGTRLEPVVAEKYQDGHPDEIVQPSGLVEGPEPWMLATPDRLLMAMVPAELHCYRVPDGGQLLDTMAVLELKTAHSAHDVWGEAGTDDIPVHYRAQVQWQMLCVDVQWAVVAVLIGGSDYREYTVLRDDRDIRVMVEYGRRFMARLQAGDPPSLDEHTATLATVRRLHPDLDDIEVDVPASVAAGYARACRMERLAKTAKKRYEIQLRAAMGRARKATTGGAFVASRSIYDVAEHTVTGHRVDRLNPPRAKKETTT